MSNLFRHILIGPIKVYQKLISPLLGPTCRYEPSCSHYMIEAINEWGMIKGFWLGLKRIGRCHPWAGTGLDPVPKKQENKCYQDQEEIENLKA